MRSTNLVVIQLVRGGPTYLIEIVYGNLGCITPASMRTVAGPVFVTTNDPGGGGGGSAIVVVALACSVVAPNPVTSTVLVAVPTCAASTRSVIVELVVVVPNCMTQETVPFVPGCGSVGQLPFVIEAPTNLISGGSGSVTVTSPVAVVPV
jgi:hypothetical protein